MIGRRMELRMEAHRSEHNSLIGIRSRGRFVDSDPVVVVVVVVVVVLLSRIGSDAAICFT